MATNIATMINSCPGFHALRPETALTQPICKLPAHPPLKLEIEPLVIKQQISHENTSPLRMLASTYSSPEFGHNHRKSILANKVGEILHLKPLCALKSNNITISISTILFRFCRGSRPHPFFPQKEAANQNSNITCHMRAPAQRILIPAQESYNWSLQVRMRQRCPCYLSAETCRILFQTIFPSIPYLFPQFPTREILEGMMRNKCRVGAWARKSEIEEEEGILKVWIRAEAAEDRQ